MRGEGKGGYRSAGGMGCLLLGDFRADAALPGLERALCEAGYAVSAPLGTEDEPRTAGWGDGLERARRAYAQLRTECERVAVLGFSMGGLLALLLAEEFPVDALVCLFTPMKQKGPMGASFRESAELSLLMARVRRGLFSVVADTLVVQFAQDELVHPQSAEIILNGVSSERRQALYLEKFGSAGSENPAYQALEGQIIAFLKALDEKALAL